MRDDSAHEEISSEPLALQALLYASDELPDEQLAAFEERLGSDQAARDALCQAVQLTLTLEGQAPRGPDPAYRERVRLRLRGRRPFWQVLTGKRSYRGHPAVWSGLGAAAAVLLMLTLGRSEPSAAPVPIPVAVPTLAPGEEPPEAVAAGTTLEEAKTWAELSNRSHLEKARDEELRRKNRVEELQRIVKTKNDERRSRLLGKPRS